MTMMHRVYGIALFIVIYSLAAWAGLSMAFEHKLISLVWPAAGIAVAAVIMYGYWLLPGVFLAAAFANFFHGANLPVALGIALGNGLEAFSAAWLMKNVGGFRHEMDRVKDVLGFVVLGALVSSTVAATAGVATLLASGDVVAAGAARAWLHWWFGDAMGMLIVAPVLFLTRIKPTVRWSAGRRFEALALFAAFLCTSHFVFKGPQLPFMLFPSVLWAAGRFERAGAILITIAIAILSVWYTLRGEGPFVRWSPEESLLTMQSYVAGIAVSGLAIAAALNERARSEERRLRLVESEVVQARLKFLAAASEILESSLRYEKTLHNVVRLMVPPLADYCILVLISPEGSLSSMLTAHRDPAKGELVQKLRGYPPDARKGHPVGEAIARRQPILVPDVTESFINDIANDAGHAELLHSLAPVSYMVVPLLRQGVVMGVLVFARTAETGLRYGEDDLALAVDVARRCVGAITNAELYEAAEQTSKVREDTVAIVSHDLKNPLTSIQLSAQLMEKLLSQPQCPVAIRERFAKMLRVQGESIKRSQSLIEDLLDFAKMESGTFSLTKAPTCVTSLLDEITHLFAPMADESGLCLAVEAPDPQWYVVCDKERVSQVLSNLIGNAIKFTPRGGHVTVTAHPRGGGILFSVRDDGPGMAPEVIAHVFERYWQPKETRGRRSAGLGLSIAKGIVAAHGGEIWVESGVGVGSEFFFSLPDAMVLPRAA